MTASTLIETVSADSLTTLLQDAGCRVNRNEQNSVVQLLSASQGVGYAVRFGNRAVEEGQFLDFTYSCALRIQGDLPEGLANLWNASRRYSRLSVQGEFLVLEKDVVVADGVTQKHLQGSLVLWDRLLQEFIVFLRDYSRNIAAAQEAAAQAESAS
ncbi:YbjN domain-containing protein [Pseudomonas sp. 148P]|uniref:YbjN domain-containing protein n=1 Tax=Pseudomonas ulcerans TaxID=3115852 RepID=A0ABU7HNJ4_9PSED|nr:MULTISPECIES: YbjN domain-containing protein [unclassified Pseudomonas]MEE1923601.1 YbjN domain-containing protein [Pseudomonas sp. 147P]MEE1933099.1 YbjN domain-containing protein [Pseudomonas sp. 148P]